MSKPGVILRRPVGSNGPFKEHAQLPTHLPREDVKAKSEKPRAKLKTPPRKLDGKSARKAAIAFAREQKQRESERRKEEAASANERERRLRAPPKRKQHSQKPSGSMTGE